MSSDLICQCLNLTRDTVVARIQAGDHNEEALSQSLRISGSCGTCRWKVRKLLAEVLPSPTPPTQSTDPQSAAT